MHSKQKSYERTSNVGLQMYKSHLIYLENFSIETRLKTVNSGGKNLGFGDERSWEKT